MGNVVLPWANAVSEMLPLKGETGGFLWHPRMLGAVLLNDAQCRPKEGCSSVERNESSSIICFVARRKRLRFDLPHVGQ